RGADGVVRPRAQRHHPFPQPAPVGGKARRGSGRGGRAGHHPGRPGVDTDVDRARLRPNRDGAVRPAVAAPVRLAQRLCDDFRTGGRPSDPAANHHVPAPACALKGIYLFSRLTMISGTSAPGVTIDTDWWLPRVVKVMLDVSPGACATAWT